MNSMAKKLAAASLISACTTVSALAGSVTQPGETVGVAAGAPLPQGIYVVDTTDWGCRNTSPEGTCVGVTIPVYAWSTPWKIFGARVQFLAATPAVDVGVNDTFYKAGWYNPLVSGQLAWDLGYGWGFSYLLGSYIDVNSPTAWSSTSLNQRFRAELYCQRLEPNCERYLGHPIQPGHEQPAIIRVPGVTGVPEQRM